MNTRGLIVAAVIMLGLFAGGCEHVQQKRPRRDTAPLMKDIPEAGGEAEFNKV